MSREKPHGVRHDHPSPNPRKVANRRPIENVEVRGNFYARRANLKIAGGPHLEVMDRASGGGHVIAHVVEIIVISDIERITTRVLDHIVRRAAADMNNPINRAWNGNARS